MDEIRYSSILKICAITGSEISQIEEMTMHMSVSEIDALGDFACAGIRFEDCMKSAKIARNEEDLSRMVNLLLSASTSTDELNQAP
ncbi:hypothetical protein DFQ01_12195 [Paenibacillus cellulosilyticus]|uniref:Uncharacterized protein n=1 Tax=Paenibacillus cellulosilyticus TaxID=375489 RepID=A0A2V2YNQ7_9BACL|nr:hypothetical protein [Paenibacillus cellulosilyticus]PWV97451.1 hypothetical protein DFQ01_12195 [Paenibacillus cellulosilyticus]QKS48511.1 hypothetical protein HUB94_30210 [Paenibacillus cellulosilyticus]